MAKSRIVKTLDDNTFEWIENQKPLSRPGRRAEAAKRRQRYFSIRNVARKEIADLTNLARTLPDDQLNQIFNVDTLKPIVNELLWGPVYVPPYPKRAQLYLERAKIAELFIKWGFDYLSTMKGNMVTLSNKRTIDEANDLARFLLETFKSEWPYYPEVHGKYQDKIDGAGGR